MRSELWQGVSPDPWLDPALQSPPGASSAHGHEALPVLCPIVQNWAAGWTPIPVSVTVRVPGQPLPRLSDSDPVVVPCLVPSSRPGHTLTPSASPATGPLPFFLEKRRGGGKVHYVQRHKGRRRMAVAGDAPARPSRRPSGPGSRPTCSRQMGGDPTKARAASATLGLCPDTCHLNLFLGTSCCQGTLLCGPGERQTSLPIWPARPRLLETLCPG